MEKKSRKKVLSKSVGLSFKEIDSILSIETLKQMELANLFGGNNGGIGDEPAFPECLCYADCGCTPRDRLCD